MSPAAASGAVHAMHGVGVVCRGGSSSSSKGGSGKGSPSTGINEWRRLAVSLPRPQHGGRRRAGTERIERSQPSSRLTGTVGFVDICRAEGGRRWRLCSFHCTCSEPSALASPGRRRATACAARAIRVALFPSLGSRIPALPARRPLREPQPLTKSAKGWTRKDEHALMIEDPIEIGRDPRKALGRGALRDVRLDASLALASRSPEAGRLRPPARRPTASARARHVAWRVTRVLGHRRLTSARCNLGSMLPSSLPAPPRHHHQHHHHYHHHHLLLLLCVVCGRRSIGSLHVRAAASAPLRQRTCSGLRGGVAF